MTNQDIRSNHNVVFSCRYHVVICPKYRRHILQTPIDERLKVLVKEIVAKWGQEFIEIEVMPDHVHILLGCDPQFGINRIVRYIKGVTSYQLRKEFPRLKRQIAAGLWTNSYFCATTGGVTLDTLKKYVEGQKTK